MRALKTTLVCLLALLVAPAAAYAQTSGNPMSPLAGVTCNGSNCKGVPNDSTHWFYGFDPTVNTSVQQLLTAIGQPLTINLPSGIATSALQTAGNASLITIATASVSQATAANQTTANTTLSSILAKTSPPGSTGVDFSANKPALPNIGAGFSGGVYAGYVLIATVPASATRANVDVENNSAAQIAIERDDGTATSGAAPVNASVFAISNGGGAGQQGGSWTSSTFKGRLQIFAPASSAQVAVMVD